VKFIGLRLRYISEALKSQSSRLSSDGKVKANILLFADEVHDAFSGGPDADAAFVLQAVAAADLLLPWSHWHEWWTEALETKRKHDEILKFFAAKLGVSHVGISEKYCQQKEKVAQAAGVTSSGYGNDDSGMWSSWFHS